MVDWIDTENLLADIFTKPIPPTHFVQLKSTILDSGYTDAVHGFLFKD
jgi:hypothetical protein